MEDGGWGMRNGDEGRGGGGDAGSLFYLFWTPLVLVGNTNWDSRPPLVSVGDPRLKRGPFICPLSPGWALGWYASSQPGLKAPSLPVIVTCLFVSFCCQLCENEFMNHIGCSNWLLGMYTYSSLSIHDLFLEQILNRRMTFIWTQGHFYLCDRDSFNWCYQIATSWLLEFNQYEAAANFNCGSVVKPTFYCFLFFLWIGFS
jgi:hypothetical protein